MYEEDRRLAERCGVLADLSRQAGDWLTENAQLVGRGVDEQRKEMRKASRLFKNCARAAERKMCVGVFGPSQAGKSYLISSLACKMRDNLWAVLGSREYDFLARINPEGGRESTGLVTRFTIARPLTPPEEFPVHVRLLSLMDLIKILANSYYSDAEHLETPDRESLLATLKELEHKRTADPVPGISVDDMEDLQSYIYQYFRGKPRVQQLLDQHFWERVNPLVPYLEDKERMLLLGLLWDNIAPFNDLLAQLWRSLRLIGYAAEVFCPIEALIPRENSIIDVKTLAFLQPKPDDELTVRTLEGKTVSLPRVYLAALTAELIIPVRDKPADFFDHTDLLDFPGYRSREEFKNLSEEAQDPYILELCFLRGKVAYLFQRYCAERELTGLLLCIAPSVQEVKGMSEAVNEWIAGAHGESPESRTGKDVALFFILTKSDMEFENKAGARDLSKRWDIRIGSSLLQPFATQHEWPKYWDKNGPFNNIFLLRNTTILIPYYDHDQQDRETDINPNAREFVASLREVFMNSELVKVHIRRREETWRSFITPNDGGIAFIRDSLNPICRPELKREQIKTTLNEQLTKLRDRLTPYWRSDNLEEQRRQSMLLGQTLARSILSLAQNQILGQFLRMLMLRDQELYDLYQHAQFKIDEEVSGAAVLKTATMGTEVSADDMLMDLLGEEVLAEIKPPQDVSPSAGPYDEARSFSAQIEKFWLSRLRELADSPAMQQFFELPGALFAALVHELATGFKRLKIDRLMEEGLRRVSRYSNMDKNIMLWKQVSLAANILNSYIDWLGYDPRRKNEAERAIIIGGRQRTLFTPPPAFQGMPALQEDAAPYNRSFYTDWAGALIKLIEDNVNFDGEQDFDPAQNLRLKKILDNLVVETL
ncbi:MAG: putative virulence factor [Desulfarculales bacterium]|jgi:hypothetical protein|nr:putative virulence factor [Desulfarculales bacterium]